MFSGKKKKIAKQIQDVLMSRDEIVFAYIYGSFVSSRKFRDIDIAVFVDPKKVKSKDMLDYELELGSELVFPCPVDVHMLNNAPVSFQHNVFRTGKLLFSRDDIVLTDLIEQTSLIMVHDNYLMQESYAALVG